jgi:hypothetical protein
MFRCRIDGLSAPKRMFYGAIMSTGLYRLLRRRFNRMGYSLGGTREAGAGPRLKSALIALVVVLVLLVGAAAWLVMSIDDSESADSGLTVPADDTTTASTPATQAVNQGGTGQGTAGQGAAVHSGTVNQGQANAAPDPTTSQGNTPQDNTSPDKPTEPPAVDGLRISSQSWRRGGLGSKALVTFTLRNDNSYAVKDVALACAFSRRDGSHLTDRTRIVPGPVGMKSRKTFAAVHVGFVNVNASKAKCTLVAASKI